MDNKIEQWGYPFINSIGIKITKWEFKIPGLNYNWCSYLLICDKIDWHDKVTKSPAVTHVLNNKNFLDDLDGWNGGVTFKEFEINMETQQRRITIGHDYAHLWDSERGRDYTLE